MFNWIEEHAEWVLKGLMLVAIVCLEMALLTAFFGPTSHDDSPIIITTPTIQIIN